ncbi:MAG: hypothetical protein ACREC6_04190 [Hyphomicrobiaceae bacterium]
MDRQPLIKLLADLFGSEEWPKPFHLLRGLMLVEQGKRPRDAARAVGTTEHRLAAVMSAPNPVTIILGAGENAATEREIERKRDLLGQLILGKAAEFAFEEIYRSELGTSEFALDDYRTSRTDTDYRMLNGNRRPVYRINIKFFGALFRNAQNYVGLAPEDCFPLATYKVFAALQKQQQEHLAYLFLIVNVPNLTAKLVGERFSTEEIAPIVSLLLSDVGRKRDLEDRFTDLQVRRRHPVFINAYEKIKSSKWYVLSARRADRLLREKLFDRVFAVRIRGFAQTFRNAELDMHFSLSEDLHGLYEFLKILREGGLQRASSMLERGDI